MEIGLSNLSVGQCVTDHAAALRSLRSCCLLDVDAVPSTTQHLLPCFHPSHPTIPMLSQGDTLDWEAQMDRKMLNQNSGENSEGLDIFLGPKIVQ